MTLDAESLRLTASLAGFTFRFRGRDADWYRRTSTRLEGFAVPETGEAFQVDVEATRPAVAADMEREREQPARASWANGRLTLEGNTYRAEADFETRRASLIGPPNAYPVDGLLRWLLASLCEDGLLVHGTLLVDGRRAWLAAGPSGCGKSTLARLFPEYAASDELSAVRKAAGGGFIGFGLPFWSGKPLAARLEGIHLLRHGRRTERHRLGPGEAIRRLGPEVMWPGGSRDATDRRLATLGTLAETVPVWDLAFRPHRSVWAAICDEVDA